MNVEIEGLRLCFDKYDFEDDECGRSWPEPWLGVVFCDFFVCVCDRLRVGLSGLDALGDCAAGGVYGIRTVGS